MIFKQNKTIPEIVNTLLRGSQHHEHNSRFLAWFFFYVEAKFYLHAERPVCAGPAHFFDKTFNV